MPLNIDLFQILLHMLNFVILAGGLSLLLFKPVKKFMEQRRECFEKQTRENAEKMLEAEQLKAEYENKLKEVECEISTKHILAEKELATVAKQCLDEAHKRADSILKAAERDAEIHKSAILKSAQTELGELVVSAAQKLLNDTESPARDSSLYDDFIALTEKNVNPNGARNDR